MSKKNDDNRFVEDGIAILNAVAPKLPSNASAFEIAQYSRAMLNLAATPQATLVRESAAKLIDQLVERFAAETKMLS